ncbi:31485_t:CDS:2, partial [Racocetra persica]
MSLSPTINDFKPVYNLVELELEDYEENELVLDTIYELKLFFQNPNNCTCRRTPKQKVLRTCFEKIEFNRFFERHFELKALEKHELELFIKLQLISFEISDKKLKNKTQKHTYRYNYNSSLLLCKPTNTGRASKTDSRVFLDLAITFPIKQFLVQYGTIHRFPSPLRHQDDSGVFIYLLTGQTYVSPCTSYLCEICTSFKAKLLVAKQDIDEYNKVQAEYNEHTEAAERERQHYNNNIEE